MTEKQRLLQEIENEVKAMTEDQKQEFLNFLLGYPADNVQAG